MGMAGGERGVRARGGAAVAASLASELSDTDARASPAPQVGSGGFLLHLLSLMYRP